MKFSIEKMIVGGSKNKKPSKHGTAPSHSNLTIGKVVNENRALRIKNSLLNKHLGDLHNYLDENNLMSEYLVILIEGLNNIKDFDISRASWIARKNE